MPEKSDNPLSAFLREKADVVIEDFAPTGGVPEILTAKHRFAQRQRHLSEQRQIRDLRTTKKT